MKRAKALLPAAGGLLLAAPFLWPPAFALAWVAFVPLFSLLAAGASRKRAFVLGWTMGIAANAAGFYWVNHTVAVFGGFPPALSAIVFFFFALYSGLNFALLALLVSLSGFGPGGVFPAALWVAIEFFFPLIFPWHLANSQVALLALIQSADVTGPYGLSFLVMWANGALAGLLFSSPPARRRFGYGLAFVALLVGASVLYGKFRLGAVAASELRAPSLRLTAVQGSIDIDRRGPAAFPRANLRSYQELTRGADGTLMLWPESTLDLWVPEAIRQFPPELLPPFPADGTFLIFGGKSFRGDPAKPDVKAFNSAFLVDSRGRVLSVYHKRVLLAFGEYVPFGRHLKLVPGAPEWIGQGFSSGDLTRTMDLPNGVRVAPLICYEDLFPSLSRRFVAAERANLLVNLTNDVWFGRTAAPWQHARLSQWRAIETRRALVRVTNTGVTTVISPGGEIVASLPLFTPARLAQSVPLLEERTLYVRFGDWFAWSAVAGSLFCLLARLLRPESSAALD